MAEEIEGVERAASDGDSKVDAVAAAARETAEHNALADAFSLVRVLSAQGMLAEPNDWEEAGIVPDHLEAEAFEMMLYEYLTSYLDEHRQERAAAKAAERAKASAHRSATTAVGVSPFMRARTEGASPEERTAADSAPESDAKTASCEETPLEVAHADDETPLGKTDAAVEDGPFPGLRIPDGYRLEEIEGEWVLVADDEAVPQRREIDCSHVELLVGQHSYYLYDTREMTESFARWAFLAAEDDPLMTFVDCVREESRTYPRPLAATNLGNPPFRMAAAEVEATWAAVRDSGDYPDVRRTVASNGDVYYYSTLGLSDNRAAALAEYDAVERALCV